MATFETSKKSVVVVVKRCCVVVRACKVQWGCVVSCATMWRVVLVCSYSLHKMVCTNAPRNS